MAYNKFWVALITVGANFLRAQYDIDLGIDDTTAMTLVNGIGAALVWLIPNR